MFDSEHGRLPLPSPATLEVMRLAESRFLAFAGNNRVSVPIRAALLGEIAGFNRPAMIVEKWGLELEKKICPGQMFYELILGEKILDTKADSFTGGLSHSVTCRVPILICG